MKNKKDFTALRKEIQEGDRQIREIDLKLAYLEGVRTAYEDAVEYIKSLGQKEYAKV